ncbi:hypothetical protein [Helicobacter felis]|uniref:hypothetical protein n=1 Tax=Helicobacter felis TaxID=214 RepID=UPI001F38155A|nr:hypothetical protein [Helicobacter felis]
MVRLLMIIFLFVACTHVQKPTPPQPTPQPTSALPTALQTLQEYIKNPQEEDPLKVRDIEMNLAQKVLDQVPLIQAFKPKDAQEARFLQTLKTLEAFYLVILIQNHMEEKRETIAQMFLTDFNLLYAPLFNAHKAGLNLREYLKSLAANFGEDMPYQLKRCQNNFDKKCIKREVSNYAGYDVDFNKEGILAPFVSDLQGVYRLYNRFLVSVYDHVWSEITLGYWDRQRIFTDVSTRAQALQEFDYLKVLHLVRALDMSTNVDAYLDLQDITPQLLQDRPTICLHPKYLTPKLQQECILVLNSLPKDSQILKTQLQNLRLFSVHDNPCAYLNPQNKLQLFPSKNALCQALQQRLQKDFDTRIWLDLAHNYKPTPFDRLIQIAEQIKRLMYKGHKAHDPGRSLITSDAVLDDLPTLEKLGYGFIDQIPLLQRLKPRDEAEEHFIAELKKFELMHLFTLLFGSLLDDEGEHPRHTPLKQVVQDYLKVLDFIYAPLIDAHQQGMNLNTYMTTLQAHPFDPSSLADSICYFLEHEQKSPKPMLPVQAFFKDFKIAELAYKLVNPELSYALLGEYIEGDYAETYAIWKWHLGDSDVNPILDKDALMRTFAPFFTQYGTRLFEFLFESYYYTFDDPFSSPELDITTLQRHPQLCLKPKYLRQKFQQACLNIFKDRTYSPHALQTALGDLALVNIDKTPCLAHDAQGKLQKLPSKNPVCLALQSGLKF